jgi:FixJ family two-component response regulator
VTDAAHFLIVSSDAEAAAAVALVVASMGHEATVTLWRHAARLEHDTTRFDAALLDAELRYEDGPGLQGRLESRGIAVGWSMAFASFRGQQAGVDGDANAAAELELLARLIRTLAERT